jgi:OmpA family
MADVFPKDRLAHEHRADEIHIHLHQKKRSWGPFIALGFFGLGLLALWSYSRNRVSSVLCGRTTIQFEQHGAALTADSKVELSKLAACLNADPKQSVKLEGRADQSELSYNATLPQGRAEAIAEELRALGVPPSQVTVESNMTPCTDAAGSCHSATAIPQPSRR